QAADFLARYLAQPPVARVAHFLGDRPGLHSCIQGGAGVIYPNARAAGQAPDRHCRAERILHRAQVAYDTNLEYISRASRRTASLLGGLIDYVDLVAETGREFREGERL